MRGNDGERGERGGTRERRVVQTEERDRVKMGGRCVCVCVRIRGCV